MYHGYEGSIHARPLDDRCFRRSVVISTKDEIEDAIIINTRKIEETLHRANIEEQNHMYVISDLRKRCREKKEHLESTNILLARIHEQLDQAKCSDRTREISPDQTREIGPDRTRGISPDRIRGRSPDQTRVSDWTRENIPQLAYLTPFKTINYEWEHLYK